MKLDTPVKQLHQQAKYYLSQKKYQEVIATCQKALTIQPNVDLYKTLAIAFHIQDQQDLALQSYLKVLEIKPEFDGHIAQTNAHQKVIKKIGYSQDILGSLPANFYDIVYIDGSHQAVAALEDALQSWRLTKVGGIIIFDDYQIQDVNNPEQQAKVGINYFLNWVSDSIKVIHQCYQLIIIKQDAGLNDEEISMYLKHVSEKK